MRINPWSYEVSHRIMLEINPSDIDFLNRIIEASDGLGLVTTIDRQLGQVVIWVTPDTRVDVMDLLSYFPRQLKVIDVNEV